jgi:hypothetical protein
MNRLAYVLGAIGRMVRTRPTPRECEIDRPASFAEIVAASAFLDFGGMPSGDWLHAWEASVDADRRPKDEDLPAANVLPQRALGNKCVGKGPHQEKTVFHPRRPKHAASEFAGPGAFPFRSPARAPMLLVDKLDGHIHMRIGSESGALELAMCVAVFGFIAGLIAFAHPTFPTSGTPNATSTPAAVTAPMPIETTLTRLGTAR